MINFNRPLGLLPLIMVLLTLFVLSTMLITMVWGRVALLQNGTQIVLKTAPIDPRDLLRGYYVRLGYDISRIAIDDLDEPLSRKELKNRFRRHSKIYIKLQPDREGFWSPRSLHHTMPANTGGEETTSRTVMIGGRVLHVSCHTRFRPNESCKISVRYGIEKYFTEKTRAKKLENFGRQTSPEINKLSKRIDDLQKKYSLAVRKIRQQANGADRRDILKSIQKRPEINNMSNRLQKMRSDLRKLEEQNRIEMAKRFAVIVRVDKNSGEAAISGLQLDGKQIYEERLF